MNFADAISRADLEPGDYVPTDSCVDCGAAIPVGQLRCVTCDAKHDEFDTNGADPRR